MISAQQQALTVVSRCVVCGTVLPFVNKKSLQSVGGQSDCHGAERSMLQQHHHKAQRATHETSTMRSNSYTDKQRSQQCSARKLAHAWMHAQTKRLAKSNVLVCGAQARRKGATRLVATRGESRGRECCRCDYVQTRRVDESCVRHVDGKEIMICG